MVARVPRCTNEKVVTEWYAGRKARNHRGSLSTDGQYLFSYRYIIGVRLSGGATVVKDATAPSGDFHSVTTSSHVNLAKRTAHTVMHPRVWEATPELEPYGDIPF